MGAVRWIVENWIDVLSAVGIVGGFCFTVTSIRSDTKTRRIGNLLTITSNHREIWRDFHRQRELKRVLDPECDIGKKPITAAEEEFVKFVMLHTSSVFYAMNDELLMKMDGMRQDVGSFLSLPIPRAVWGKIKEFQNADFLAFVEDCVDESIDFKEPLQFPPVSPVKSFRL